MKRKTNEKSILIINFLFEIFLNSLSEMVNTSYFAFKAAVWYAQEYSIWFGVLPAGKNQDKA